MTTQRKRQQNTEQEHFSEGDTSDKSVEEALPTVPSAQRGASPQPGCSTTTTEVTNQPLGSASTTSSQSRDNTKKYVSQQNTTIDRLTTLDKSVNKLQASAPNAITLGGRVKEWTNDEIKAIFPLKSLPELTALEEELRDENSKRKLLHVFPEIERYELKYSVGKVMEFVFSDWIAKEYNWTGRNGRNKRALRKLRVARLIVDHIQKSNPNVKRQEVEVTIKLWLKNAKNRHEAQLEEAVGENNENRDKPEQ